MSDETTAPVGLIGADTALFLDFDGTLTALRDDPDLCALPEGGAEALTGLSAALGGALAMVSGRDARDLTRRTPLAVWRAGNHGGIVLAPGQAEPDAVPEAPDALLDAARRVADANPGVKVEEKAAVLAVHTRACPECEPDVLAALRHAVARIPGYKLQHGKRVIELKPEGVDKGIVIRRLMGHAPFAGRAPVFVGDDTTDEDGFAAVAALGGAAVKVGDGATSARYRLADPDAVWDWLRAAHDEIGRR